MSYVWYGVLAVAVVLMVVLARRGRNMREDAGRDADALPAQPGMPENAPVFMQEGISPEVVAAIAAAVAACWEGEGGFTVRHIRRISNAPVWSRAGREEQIYSRL